jgi:hypothetical protein
MTLVSMEGKSCPQYSIIRAILWEAIAYQQDVPQ